jgi:DNA-directed RNA polymerase specialized sigma24 family protein
MYYTDELQADAIASKLSLSVEAVWKKLSRGRKSLKRCVEKQLSG